MWTKRDWHEFYLILRQRWQQYRPPRPVRLSGGRLVPAAGFSVRELNDAGLTAEQAETLGLPVEAGRVGSFAANVFALRSFVRAAREKA